MARLDPGKSRLALDLIAAAAAGRLRFARLVGDDRVHLEKSGGRLLVRPAATLAGMIEQRGTGIRHVPYEPCAVVGLVVDLAAKDAERLPEQGRIELEGVTLARLAVAADVSALSGVLELLTYRMTGQNNE